MNGLAMRAIQEVQRGHITVKEMPVWIEWEKLKMGGSNGQTGIQR